jgi:UDP:flavonoid glycosyltransferase YjiC (YdhE family)
VWPDADGPRLFAYLRHDYPAIEAVLQQLATAPSRTLLHAVGLTAAQRQRHASASLRFSDGPVDMDMAMAQADAVLCHASSGTACTGLQAGLPQLMLPMQVEQMIFARRAQACGVGEWLLAADIGARLLPTLDRVLGDTGLRQRAQAMAERHRYAHHGDAAQRVAERCIELTRTAAPPATAG